MTTFEALSLMNNENVENFVLDHQSLQIDCPDMNLSVFYTTFDGKC